MCPVPLRFPRPPLSSAFAIRLSRVLKFRTATRHCGAKLRAYTLRVRACMCSRARVHARTSQGLAFTTHGSIRIKHRFEGHRVARSHTHRITVARSYTSGGFGCQGACLYCPHTVRLDSTPYHPAPPPAQLLTRCRALAVPLGADFSEPGSRAQGLAVWLRPRTYTYIYIYIHICILLFIHRYTHIYIYIYIT